MKAYSLNTSERIATWFTHLFVLTHEDLTESTDNTAQSFNLTGVDLVVGDVVQDVLLDVRTAFAKGTAGGTAYTNAVNATVGVTGAATQFLGNSDIRSAVPYAVANSVAPYAVAATGKKLILVVTPGAGEDALEASAGELHVYARISRKSDRPAITIV